MKTFVGVADCHGLESFMELEKCGNPVALKLRADANRQRHAIFYQIKINSNDEEKVKKLIDKEDYKKALSFVKTLNIMVPPEHIHSLGMIPNDDLDPHQ